MKIQDEGPVLSAASTLDEERERIHRQMLSSVSHDLKTPLASIIGSLEIHERMRERLSDQQRQSLISVALQEGYRLDAFVTNILDMAKFENGMVKAQVEEIDIDNLLQNCTTRLQHRLNDCSLRVTPVTGNFILRTDPVLLCRAITLVLDNAVKYGGQPPVIDIQHGVSDDMGFIEIRDNGRGIAEGHAETIFAKYTRFATQDRQLAGTGLGLSIAREIMRLLGGTVTAGNHKNGGAVFKLRFRIA